MNDSYPQKIEIGTVTVSPPVLSAPMAGFTNFAFRHMVRKLGGVGLIATEMVSARSAFHVKRLDNGEPDRLWGVKDEGRPLAVQIWDNDPDTMADVARRLVDEYRVSVVDINFGCPVRDVSEKAESGSYLLQFPDRIGRIVERLARECSPTPVTAKIRLGRSRDEITAHDVAQAVEAAGGAALTVHGRTARDMYRGQADWDAIARLRDSLKHIPLIGNGDLVTPEAAAEAFAKYGVDGIMIGRAGLGRPWLFCQVAAAISRQPIPSDPSLVEQRDLLLEHYALLIERFGEQRATVLMRKYACCYSQGLPGARAFRRDVSRAVDRQTLERLVRALYPESL